MNDSNIAKAPSRIFEPSDLDNIEDIELYRPGGFHPVHIGDTLDNDRYQVVHKLGYGGFSTVWLCRDRHLHQYVAVKILTAVESNRPLNLEFGVLHHLEQQGISSNHPGKQYVSLLTHHFQIDGPNGSHKCLVSRAAGPSIATLAQGRFKEGGWICGDLARRLSLQVTQGLAYLHSCGIGHGDLTGSNILVDIAEFHSWPQDKVYEVFGKPFTNPVRYISHEKSGDSASAPSYVVEPIDFSTIDTNYLDPRIQIIDLGQSFYLNTPPADGLGTPLEYRAPELMFDEDASAHSDVWALGCSIFEIRTGQNLFEAFSGTKNGVLEQIVKTLGILPEPWWSVWDGREDTDEGVQSNDHSTGNPEGSDSTLRQAIIDVIEDENDRYMEAGEGVPHANNLDAVWKETLKMQVKEVDDIKDLLEKLLTYRPEERISAEEASQQAWFHRDSF